MPDLSQQRRALRAAAEILGGPIVRVSRSVRGLYGGHPICFELSPGTGWVVTAFMKPLPLAMRVREASMVEASVPAPIAAQMLEGSVQRRLELVRPGAVEVVPGRVRVRKEYRVYFAEAEHIQEAIRLAMVLATRVAPALRSSQEALERACFQAQGPYRGSPDARLAVPVITEQARAVDAIQRRAERAFRRSRAALIAPRAALFLMFLLFVALVAFAAPPG